MLPTPLSLTQILPHSMQCFDLSQGLGIEQEAGAASAAPGADGEAIDAPDASLARVGIALDDEQAQQETRIKKARALKLDRG